MTVTKMHFELVAGILRECLADPLYQLHTVRNIALKFADSFKAANPRFDRDRFLKACGL